MSPSDTQMLHDFLGQLVQARGIRKDPEADALIQRAVAQQPDAAYLLVQRVLLMEQALDSAKAQIAALESQLQQQQHQTSRGGFLDPYSWGSRRHASHPQSHHMHYQHAMPGSMGGGFLRGGGGGLLGSIAATAAGVAAGSFLFHGLDNLFHDHDGNGGAHLLGGENLSSGDFGGGDLSGSALADQAGLNDIGTGDSLLGAEGGIESSGGFFDGDGSDEGLFG